MEELIESLKKSCEEMELIIELTRKYNDNKVVADKLFNKKLEDGILAKLNTANLYQLKTMKNGYNFRYYDKSITDKLIDIAITKCIRKDKLNKINSVRNGF